MNFDTPLFVFLFLPVILAAHFLAPRQARNLLLLGASLFLYTWYEGAYTLVLLLSVVGNYALALLSEAAGRWRSQRRGRAVLGLAVIFNIGLLGVFKFAQPLLFPALHLPLGISFFTFQALAYVIDAYRGEISAQKNLARLALFFTLFPKLAAGPILRYGSMASQLVQRTITREEFAYGVRRFIIGLGKKTLIANTLALPADAIAALPGVKLSPSLAWFGVVCITLRLYYDFSGYTDIAIGLGHMFGFTLPENFNLPFTAQSVQDFWRRWHITLTDWMRDYLFFPLGRAFARRFSSPYHPANLIVPPLVTMLAIGLWHGASWNFVAFGLYHAVFMIIEQAGWRRWLNAGWRPLRHIYTLLVVLPSFVFFQPATLNKAMHVFANLAGVAGSSPVAHNPAMYLDTSIVLALAAALLGALPVLDYLALCKDKIARALTARVVVYWEIGSQIAVLGALALVFLLSIMQLAAATHRAFLYFQF